MYALYITLGKLQFYSNTFPTSDVFVTSFLMLISLRTRENARLRFLSAMRLMLTGPRLSAAHLTCIPGPG